MERFNESDKENLDSLSIQFNSFMLNDSTWVKKSQLLEKLPVINTTENLQLLKKTNLVQPYYFLWQINAFLVAKRLCKKERFDFVHHITFVSIRSFSLCVYYALCRT